MHKLKIRKSENKNITIIERGHDVAFRFHLQMIIMMMMMMPMMMMMLLCFS